MSEAADKLARSRQAILDQIAGRQRRHDPREEPSPQGLAAGEQPREGSYVEEPYRGGESWFAHMQHVVATWWRYHPAHMVVDLASPLMRGYAQRKPVQLLAVAAATGAVLTFVRPWKLISVGTLLVFVLKSSQLSSLAMAALSAADYRKDNNKP